MLACQGRRDNVRADDTVDLCPDLSSSYSSVAVSLVEECANFYGFIDFLLLETKGERSTYFGSLSPVLFEREMVDALFGHAPDVH